MSVLEIILWVLVGSVVYSMLLYPLILPLLAGIARREFIREPVTPRVSLLISAFNEEAAIATKLENSLDLDYPADRLEIVVASDGSTDGTDEIVRGFADRGVKLVRFDGGMGKTAVLNHAVEHTTGEILVFSDATGMYDREAVRIMTSHFADPRVGCVSGRVGYEYDKSNLASRGFGVYQKYAYALRQSEGAFGSLSNASGSIHAMRRSVFRIGPSDTFMDMIDPLHTAMQGFRTTFADDAVSMEEVREQTHEEFRARLRIGMRAWRFMAYALPRLPILRSPMYCFQVTSHKFLRWLVGPALLPILVLNLLVLDRGPIYWLMLAGQIAFYGLTLLGLLARRVGSKIPGLGGLVFFNATNLAYVIALLRYVRGQRVSQWVPSR